ncbi:YdiK family protein [Oceanobacillus halotolerans]|uniref:YdiK family protein n=1 Tax=Oceanobacillus halotolerans TaxID=2663380 RepID=UPI0013DC21B5|nr:YdiK family protein [Oceanobacillus halotolerans]
MRISPKAMSIIYLLMGVLFVYIAIQSVEDTIWNITTMVFAVVASLDFGVGIRLMSLHFRLKKKK